MAAAAIPNIRKTIIRIPIMPGKNFETDGIFKRLEGTREKTFLSHTLLKLNLCFSTIRIQSLSSLTIAQVSRNERIRNARVKSVINRYRLMGR